ncbi:MAG: hypothetical protein ACI8R9_001559 [Paraglaciecola sp.]
MKKEKYGDVILNYFLSFSTRTMKYKNAFSGGFTYLLACHLSFVFLQSTVALKSIKGEVEMSFHHRSSKRTELALDVDVRHRGKYIGSTCTRDISPFGVFIELSSTHLAADDFLEIHFLDKRKKNQYLLQKGLIVHRNKDGFGVLFSHDKDEFRHLLKRETPEINSDTIVSSK